MRERPRWERRRNTTVYAPIWGANFVRVERHLVGDGPGGHVGVSDGLQTYTSEAITSSAPSTLQQQQQARFAAIRVQNLP